MYLLLLLLPSLASSLQCYQCREVFVDGFYYDNEPRACEVPTLDTCEDMKDICLSAAVSFTLDTGESLATIELLFKYCDYQNSTCDVIEQNMLEGVDFGEMDNYKCQIGTHCDTDGCNDKPVVSVVDQENMISEPALTTSNSPSDIEEYVVVIDEVDNSVETHLEVDVEINEVDMEGNEQAQTSGQSKNFRVSAVLSVIACGIFFFRS